MSRRLVFAVAFIAAALALAGGIWWQYPLVTLSGAMGLLLVFAGGVYAALPSHRAAAPARKAEPVGVLTPVPDDDYDATFTVVAHHPAGRADDAQRKLWGPPATSEVPVTVAPRAGPPVPVAVAPAARAAPRVLARPPPPARNVIMPRSEWARAESAPAVVTPTRAPSPKSPTTRGLCSQCGTHLTLSAERPLRATCPVCGHSKVLN